MTDAKVHLWGKDIGAVSWLENRQIAIFQFMPDFAQSDIQLSPIMMPLSPNPYEFPSLAREAFKGLPGMLADSLPDKFGNALLDAWLSRNGRAPASFNPVERLCYIGRRGMGALEFLPASKKIEGKSTPVHIDELTKLANEVLNQREQLGGVLQGNSEDQAELEEILKVGTSAGGARAKAILAWNEKTGEFRSGQVSSGEGYSYWLMKFDGISKNSDKELSDPKGFGLIEYGFYLLAKAAGIDMSACRIHKEGGRSHFMTRRFDRSENGGKIHMQSLAALRHYDFNAAGANSYEQAVETIRLMGLPSYDIEQQFRRAIFNVLIRNQDDHVKNIAFLMNRKGEWRLSPAFDVAYAHNPSGSWTHLHQMSLNGKRDKFEFSDLVQFGEFCQIKAKRSKEIIKEMQEKVEDWPVYANKADVKESTAIQMHKNMRHQLLAL